VATILAGLEDKVNLDDVRNIDDRCRVHYHTYMDDPTTSTVSIDSLLSGEKGSFAAITPRIISQ
jgi:hypothetical protein